MRVGRKQGTTTILAALGSLALGACGSTKTLTVTNTVVKESTTTVTASASLTAPTTTTATAATAPAPGAGAVPVLNGTYNLDQTASAGDFNLGVHAHDGLFGASADKTWAFTNGSCTATTCQISLRRLLSDSTIEDLTLFSKSPAGDYTGTIPGGDGKASCGGSLSSSVKLSMIVRVGGLQNVGGQTVAQRLAGHIFADYQCPGSGPNHDVATYVGTHS